MHAYGAIFMVRNGCFTPCFQNGYSLCTKRRTIRCIDASSRSLKLHVEGPGQLKVISTTRHPAAPKIANVSLIDTLDNDTLQAFDSPEKVVICRNQTYNKICQPFHHSPRRLRQ
ncbi:hypothetical protein M7I_7675 [Glarea lozoyensis 74030]|uniref:Uncharacterized protein n=1 Tax=Glarea lozoyensis (strain ATCC 74030 / MF5533) TaxID=1104152 RepID=H0EXY2_GLAL7|nr:hypothetical protein M7I_7675 [Glarea lozoyensis 74030]